MLVTSWASEDDGEDSLVYLSLRSSAYDDLSTRTNRMKVMYFVTEHWYRTESKLIKLTN